MKKTVTFDGIGYTDAVEVEVVVTSDVDTRMVVTAETTVSVTAGLFSKATT